MLRTLILIPGPRGQNSLRAPAFSLVGVGARFYAAGFNVNIELLVNGVLWVGCGVEYDGYG